MPWYKKVVVIMIGIILYNPAANGSGTVESAKNFVRSLGKKAIDTLTHQTLPESQIKSQFRALLHEGFEIRSIAQFVLAQNWRRLSTLQQSTFQTIFVTRLENAYAARFKEYKGAVLTVKEGRQERDGGVIVNSLIQKPGGPIIHVDWKIYQTSQGPKIFDVTVDGVSMSITLRSDYAAAFQKAGGQVEVFLNNLR